MSEDHVQCCLERRGAPADLGEQQAALQPSERRHRETIRIGLSAEFTAVLHRRQAVANRRLPASELRHEILASRRVDLGELGGHEINTALPSRRALQDLNRTDTAAVDDALRPKLAARRAAVSGH